MYNEKPYWAAGPYRTFWVLGRMIGMASRAEFLVSIQDIANMKQIAESIDKGDVWAELADAVSLELAMKLLGE